MEALVKAGVNTLTKDVGHTNLFVVDEALSHLLIQFHSQI